MAENKNTSKRVASEVSKIRSKTASAMAKSVARSALKQIFDEEVKQRESERQHTLSRPATASHSHSA